MGLDEDSKKYLLFILKQIDENSSSVNELAKRLCSKISESRGFDVIPTEKAKIIEYLYKYQYKQISEKAIIDYCASIVEPSNVDLIKETQSNNTYIENITPTEPVNRVEENINQNTNTTTNKIDNSYKGDKNSKSNSVVNNTTPVANTSYVNKQSKKADKEVVVDVDTDIIISTTEEFNNIEKTVEESKVEIPSGVVAYATEIDTIINESKEEITKSLDETKEAMVQMTDLVSEIDDSMSLVIFDKLGFTDLNKMAYDYKKNKKVMEAQKEFFVNGGCKIDGNFAVKTVNGKECKYDMKKHKFYVNGVESLEAYFYVPSGVSDYSNLNTYTFFAEGDAGSKDYINQQATNSVVTKIMKFDNRVEFNKYSETATLTKFVNSVAKTKLDKGCYNVIGGDSVYGTHSLRITAQNPDVYQKVYCVNNAAIVTGENGVKAAKTKFDNLTELKGLNKKDIYFISVTGDSNLYYGAHGGDGWYNYGHNYEKSYLYTGLNLVCKNCPEAKVHMVYNDSKASSGESKLITLLKDLENKYSNYSYDSKHWQDFANAKYTGHGQGKFLVSELANASVTNYNEVKM